MPLFAILSIALSVAVFALVLRPIWREKPGIAIAVSLACAAASLGVYRLVGTPAALDADNLRAPQTMAEAVAILERKMTDAPDRDGLILLADAYVKLGKDIEARDTWERALSMTKTDAPVQASELVAAAEARMRASGERRFDERAVSYLERAIKQDPQHQRARFFLGLTLRQRGKAADAAAMWEPLLAQLDAGNAKTLREEVDAARKEAGLPPLPPAAEAPAAASAAGVRVKVSLDPDFAARVRLRGDATVFVIARAPNGPPMPVAVEKHPMSALPLDVVLDDGDSPMPTAKLSALREVELIARLSESGNAMRQDGDLESKPIRVALPAKEPVELILGAP
ncbi:MAG: cytochrome C biogenesis protein [Xanthomonadaceae bacterium]|nr:cytochrome C biogenesis protein [Xanthomonadaceae bacterium]